MDEIKRYENINKFVLTDEEREWVRERVDFLFDGFLQLEDIDTSDISPLISVLNLSNIMRDDVASEDRWREKLLSTAHTDNPEYFELPRILQ